MKLKFIYTIFSLLLVASLFMSNSSGRAAGGGGNSTVAGCSGGGACHKGGTFQAKSTLTITKGGVAVTEYTPGATYDVTLKVEKSGGSGTPAGYGFQLSAINGGKDAGIFSEFAPAADIQASNLGGRTFIEHNKIALSGTFSMKWTAPAKGTGEVAFLAAGNAVNNSKNFSGDSPTTPIAVSLTEGKGVAANALPYWATEVSISPNPALEMAYVTVISNEATNATIQLYDLQGKSLQSTTIQITIGKNYIPLNINDLSKGMYFMNLESEKTTTTRRFVKL
jgi:Secretion system C-terminal sorting domain/Reeler domain